MKKLLICFCASFFLMSAKAQDTIWLKGKLVQDENLEPVFNAIVRIGEIKVTSDKLGIFSIQVLLDKLNSQGMDIEANGFDKVHLCDVRDSAFLFIKLHSQEKKGLEDVSVSFGCKDIMRRVLEDIPLNYTTKPFNKSVIQFTQIHIDDTTYILNDLAHLKYYISGYGEKKNSFQIQLVQNRQTVKDYPIALKKDKEAPSWHLMGAYDLLPLSDMIFKRSNDTAAQENYSYKLLPTTKLNGRSVYPLQFKTIDSTKAGWEGVLFVDCATYGVSRFVRHLNKEGRSVMAKKNKGADFFLQDEITYGFDGQKWFVQSLHKEGYQVRIFRKKIHQMNFTADAVDYPEKFSAVDKIPFFERIGSYMLLDKLSHKGTDESWKPVLNFIHTKEFTAQYPWLSQVNW